MAEDFKITPYEVDGRIDYEKFAAQFGISLIDKKLEARIEKLAGDTHFMLRRHIFYAHRDLNWLLDEYEKGNRFYLYTGIAPSGSMTLGHLIPFMMTQWLQERFGVEVYIQIPDEEKALVRNVSFEEVHQLAYDDALNIMALGYDPKRTKIFFDTDYAGTLYKQAVRVAKHITFSMVKDAFGFTNETNDGSIFYTSMQAVPAFLKSVEESRNVPCLIPLAIDQDVHFRVARDVLGKLGYYKPSIIHAKFLPGLDGRPKMASSDPINSIYLNDAPESVGKKVHKAITGQQSTAELQKKFGGDPERCAVCQYYRFLFEPDDAKLEKIFEGERKGTLLAGEHKRDLAERINRFLSMHARKKEKLRDRLGDYIAKG